MGKFFFCLLFAGLMTLPVFAFSEPTAPIAQYYYHNHPYYYRNFHYEHHHPYNYHWRQHRYYHYYHD